MRMDARGILSFGAALMFTLAAGAQEPEGGPGPGPVMVQGPMAGPDSGDVMFGPGPFGAGMQLLGFGGLREGKVVTGAPFSAVAVAETKQTLGDGTNINRKVQSNVYRDAQGRFRKEVNLTAIGPLAAAGAPKSLIIIHDPVAGVGYILDPDKKVAGKLPPRRKGADGSGGPAEPPQYKKSSPNEDANVKKESLGTQTINGISAQGTRYTRTIPVGQIGNDKPLTVVKEEWYSPDLQIVVQSKRSDPFMGETTYTLTNIQRTAPNPALFSVPADYTVKEGPLFGGRHGQWHRGEAPLPPAEAPGPGASPQM